MDVFFEKLRSESPQMVKSQNLHVPVYLRSNIPQNALALWTSTILKYFKNTKNRPGPGALVTSDNDLFLTDFFSSLK
jgi:hypothetical protein